MTNRYFMNGAGHLQMPGSSMNLFSPINSAPFYGRHGRRPHANGVIPLQQLLYQQRQQVAVRPLQETGPAVTGKQRREIGCGRCTREAALAAMPAREGPTITVAGLVVRQDQLHLRRRRRRRAAVRAKMAGGCVRAWAMTGDGRGSPGR